MSKKTPESHKQDLLSELVATHLALKTRVRKLQDQMQNQGLLTEAEKLEYVQLKKEKLLTKDRIQLLQQT